jgi:hypothetical protein
VSRWSDRWNTYWFPPASTRNLAVCRIVAVAAQLLWFFPSLDEHLNLLAKNPEFIHPQLLVRAISAVLPAAAVFNPGTLTALYWLTAAAGVLALAGCVTRASLFVFALGNWLFIAHLYSYGDVHHTQAVFLIFLMLLAFAPSGERLSLDAVLRRRRADDSSELAHWPLKLAHVLLAMTYFSAGMSKLLHSGIGWMNGYTLQAHSLEDALDRGFPLGIWLSQQHTLAVALSVFTILLEIFFFVSLIVPRLAPLFFAAALMGHVGLYVTAGYDFFQHMVLLALLLLFLDPAATRDLLRRVRLFEAGARRNQPA